MIFGDYNQPFQIHIDKILSEQGSKWGYGAFNLVIDGRFYPGKEINWTLNIIVDWLKSFLNENIDDFYMENCEKKEAFPLFKDAVVSRLGYYYDEPENTIPLEVFRQKYPKSVGIEVPLFEISDTGLELYFFRGEEKDFLVFSFEGEISKIELEKGYFHKVISSLPDF